MELQVNLAMFDNTARVYGNWRPGVLRIDADGLAFLERGSETAEALATNEIASVSITTHLLGADDVVVGLHRGGSWSLKVDGGGRIVEALRERGVAVQP